LASIAVCEQSQAVSQHAEPAIRPAQFDRNFFQVLPGSNRFGFSVRDLVASDVIVRTLLLSGRLRGCRWNCYRRHGVGDEAISLWLAMT
jgi:hypothetical protein